MKEELQRVKMAVADPGDYNSDVLFTDTQNASNKIIVHPRFKNFKIFESKTGQRNSPIMYSVRDYDTNPINTNKSMPSSRKGTS